MKIDGTNRLFRQETKFIGAAAKPNQLLRHDLAEIAFIGKSNVGKSSLINAICNRKALARVSHTPGRTQQINFFSVGNRLVVTDLPGYGFAKVPPKLQQEWEKLILYYFEYQHNLKKVNILIDGRHGIKEPDIGIMEMLHNFGRDCQIVFTKMDKVSKIEELKFATQNLLASLNYLGNVIFTSSRNKDGAKELQLSMAKFAR